jgi:hypothetical protein
VGEEGGVNKGGHISIRIKPEGSTLGWHGQLQHEGQDALGKDAGAVPSSPPSPVGLHGAPRNPSL